MWLKNIINCKNKNSNEYELLTPNDGIENKAEDALKFSLENKKIRNIAITGPYSSGKSSVIQSYFNKNIKKKDYLNISLATFEKKTIEESNLLEKIIIEKLYYSVLNKYDKYRDIINSILSGIITIFINLSIYLFNMELINKSIINNFGVAVLFIILEIICLTSFVAYSISYLMNLQKLKLKIGTVEVEVNQTGNKKNNRNLLNEELELIMKTMKIGKYKYVVFEDLDRFQNPKIFERLRDLNITLNSALKHKVKFIYAIRDEMFIDDNRTKFFDFIIPVVPYVSYENSGEELLKILKKYGLNKELSEDFILDISLYISDVRILKNTVNEYIIYKKTLGKVPPNYEKLFAILLYKNTCSEDFAELQNKKGKLYGCFIDKKQKIEETIKNKYELIKKKNKEYEEIQKNIISKNHLKELLIYNIIVKLDRGYTITLKNEKYGNIDITSGMDVDLLSDEIIFSNDTLISYYRSGRKEETLNNFLKDVSSEFLEQFKLYMEGIDSVKEKILEEIHTINDEIEKIKECTLSELMQYDNDCIQIQLDSYNDLINYLLSNGYIDENYNTYINKFHEGSITEKDYNFIMNVRNYKKNDYKEKLDNSIKIIKRLKNIDFKKEEILNIDILDVLLENQDYIEKKEIFFDTLIKSNRYMEFVKYCICESTEFKNKNKLLIDLCNFDRAILKRIHKSKIEQKYKNILFENLVIEIEISKLKELNGIENLIKEIEKNNLLKNSDFNCIKNKISELNLKYHNISELKNNIELYDYIVENNRFKINYENIFSILVDNEKSNIKSIEEKNYEMIFKNMKLKEYINKNIQYYIDNVYSKLLNDQKNDISIVKELLNSNINKEGKYIIINKESNRVDNISDIKDIKLWKEIFDKNFVEFTWDNINSYYKINSLDETLIQKFNNEDELKNILSDDILIENKSSIQFIKDLFLSNELNDKVYDLIINKSEYKLNDALINNLKKDRIIKLINSKKIAFNIEMIKRIRMYSIDIFIIFIKNNYSGIHREIDNNNIILSIIEINEILKSDVTPTIKSKIIKMIPDEEIDNITIDFAENIANMSIENNFKRLLNERLLLKIITIIDDINLKIKLLNLNFNVVNKDNVDDFLINLNSDYSKIIVNRTRPKFANNKQNKELIGNIKGLGYNINYDINEDYIVLRNTVR